MGTADAIYQNIDWLDRVDPEYVLILSGDHIYSCTYREMLKKTIEADADCTIAVYPVSWEEAPRFGILVTDKEGNIVDFQEKPKKPISNLASMGIYIFPYKILRAALIADAKDEKSEHDFGKNIIPKMMADKKKLVAYTYHGYWKDVGTIASLHQANMDLLLSGDGATNLYTVQGDNRIYSEDTHSAPSYIGEKAHVVDCLINQGANVLGYVDHCVISGETVIEEGAVCKNAVIMNGAIIRKGAKVEDSIIGPDTLIDTGESVNLEHDGISLVVNGKAGK